MEPWFRVSRCFNIGLAHLYPGGSLHDTASERILGVEIPWTLSQRFPRRVYHRKWMLRQLLTPPAGRIPCFVGARSTTRHRPRPTAKSTSSERLEANRAHALLEVPIGTVVWQDFTDRQGRIQRCRTEVNDHKTPYWRVRHANGYWEELTRTGIEQRKRLTSKVSK